MRYLIILLMPSLMALANPYSEAFITEIQASPDSLERIEVYNPNDFPWELSNCQIRTNEGISTTQDSIYIPPYGYFVIDHNNTQGVFSLNDTSDSIAIWVHFGESVYKYPALPADYAQGPTPPFNGSVSFYAKDGFYLQSNWYIDSTPTFGLENDDWSSISVRVLDLDSNLAFYTEIFASGPTGDVGDYPYPSPREPYNLRGLGAGKYWVTARYSHDWYAYPESIEVGYNEHLTGYDIIFPFDAVQEKIRKGKNIPLTAKNQIFDALGRKIESKAHFSKGVYFKTTETGIKKFVIAH